MAERRRMDERLALDWNAVRAEAVAVEGRKMEM